MSYLFCSALFAWSGGAQHLRINFDEHNSSWRSPRSRVGHCALDAPTAPVEPVKSSRTNCFLRLAWAGAGPSAKPTAFA
jgi:hypothetical protein